MKALTLAKSLLAILAVGMLTAQDEEHSLKKKFLSEYPDAIKAWEAKSSRAEGKIKYTEDRFTKKGKAHRETLYSFKCKFPDMAVLTSAPNPDGGPEQRVDAYNRNYSFSLRRIDEGGDSSIHSLQEAGKATHPPTNWPTSTWLQPFLRVPYSSLGANLKLITRPRFVLRAVSPVNRYGKNLLRVEFDVPSDPNRAAVPVRGRDTGGHEGFFLVSPEEKWVLYEYEYREKKGTRLYKRTVSYQGTLDGFPIPNHVTGQTLKLPEGDIENSYFYDFLEFRFADVPDSDFTLTAFGIPETVARPSSVARKSRFGYWFLALALAAMAAAVVFKVAASRRQRASSAR